MQGKLSEAQNVIKMKDEEIERLMRRCEEDAAKFNTVQADYNSLLQKMREMQHAQGDTKAEAQQIEREAKAAQRESERELSSLQQELERARETLKRMEGDKQRLEERIEALEAELKSLRKAQTKAGNSAQATGLESWDMAEQLSQVQEERDYLVKHLKDFERKLIELEGELSRAYEANSSLEIAIEDATRDKMKAIEVAEMLVLQKTHENESDMARFVNSNGRQSLLPYR